jgi:fructosamine-3-kinase
MGMIRRRPCCTVICWAATLRRGRREIPSFYDPAVYFGDRDSGVAMTELFGGFGDSFLTANSAN